VSDVQFMLGDEVVVQSEPDAGLVRELHRAVRDLRGVLDHVVEDGIDLRFEGV